MKIDFSRPIEAPVLFMVFNRPEKTRQVFEMIRAVRPEKLYVAVDHPREGRQDDEVNCAKVKAIVENVDWPCEAHYLYHPENRGCTLAGKMAWDWFFEHEDRMIFLEDDGLVTRSFFHFCDYLLKKYEDDERIGYISGINHGLQKNDGTSYFFTRLSSSTYAMATWRRTYRQYEYKMESYLSVRDTKEFRDSFESMFAYRFFRRMFDEYVTHGGNTYDTQMCYLVHRHRLLNIVPNVNMTTNIGFDSGAHGSASSANNPLANRPRFDIGEVIDPQDKSIDARFERAYTTLRLLHGGSRLEYSIKAFAKKILRRR
jgi:hypothetical protein